MLHLNHRAAALVFAFAVTLATLAGVDSLARPDAAATLAKATPTAPAARG
jgi:hypothetical protein